MFAEDLSLFLLDQGVPCQVGSTQFTGLLNQPDVVLDLQRASAHSRQYELVYATASAVIAYGATVTVAGQAYTAREHPKQVGDGAFSTVLLTKD